jgi:RNA polymerase sigma-70 factor, ECF subfamily
MAVKGAMASVEQRFAAGDTGALRELYDRYAGRMYAVAYRVLSDHGYAADAVQQAFVQAWRAAGTYDPDRSIGPWLYAITRHAAIDLYRRDRDRSTIRPEPGELEAVPAGHSPTMEQTWVVWQVRAALAALSPNDQAIIKLAFHAGLSHLEIARRLDIPIGTVKSRSFRAQRKLAESLRHLRPEPAGA